MGPVDWPGFLFGIIPLVASAWLGKVSTQVSAFFTGIWYVVNFFWSSAFWAGEASAQVIQFLHGVLHRFTSAPMDAISSPPPIASLLAGDSAPHTAPIRQTYRSCPGASARRCKFIRQANRSILPKSEAYKAVKSNAGSAGVDGQSIEQFDSDLRRNLYKLWNRMSSGSQVPLHKTSVSKSTKAAPGRTRGTTLVSVTAYEALNTPTIRRLIPPCRHQLWWSSSFSMPDPISSILKSCDRLHLQMVFCQCLLLPKRFGSLQQRRAASGFLL